MLRAGHVSRDTGPGGRRDMDPREPARCVGCWFLRLLREASRTCTSSTTNEWQSADSRQRFASNAIERYVKTQFSRYAATSKTQTCSAIGLAETRHPISVESHVPRSSVRAWFRLRGSTHRRRTSRSCRISVQCRIGLQLVPFMTPPFWGAGT